MKRLPLFLISLFLFTSCLKQSVETCCEEDHFVKLNDSTWMAAPSIFTPNGDGLNDKFQIHTKGDLINFTLEIKKNGTQIFYSTDPGAKWHGLKKGKDASEGKYNFKAELTFADGRRIDHSGKFCLIREAILSGSDIENCDQCTFSDQIDPDLGFVHPISDFLCWF